MRHLTFLSPRYTTYKFAAVALLLCCFHFAAIGQVLYGLSNNRLISFKASLPGAILSSRAITGVDASMPLAGLDFRPATGELYALGYDAASGSARLYTLDLKTGAATAIGTASITLRAGMGKISFDFNPTVDRIRVTGSNNANYRLHPVTGAVAATDGNLAYASTDRNAGRDPSIGTGAYTNSYIGATSTTLYNYDDSLNVLTIQNPPNNGTLNTVGNSSIIVNLGVQNTDLDIYYDPSTGTNKAFLSANNHVSIANFSRLYAVNLSTAKASLIGFIGPNLKVDDIAVMIERVVPPQITGNLAYALSSNNNLLSFDTDKPELIRSATAISGITAGQTLSGMDFRPATGELYGLGYNATSGEAQIYKINPANAMATAVGTAPIALKAGMGKISFDFNPTVDRIRVTGSDGANYRLHPVTGLLAATDGNLSFATTDSNAGIKPAIGTGAYINSYIGATSTVLYNYDDNLNILTTQNPPNNGTLNTVGASGIAVSASDPSSDLDIYFNPNNGVNAAFLVANTSSANDNLYKIDLLSGAASLVGRIGGGIAITDLALFIDRTVPPQVIGALAYALTSTNNLITFDTDNPGIVRSLVPVSGIAAGQMLSGLDFRPATGELYALGYNATTGEAQLYTLNATTGAATAIGTTAIALKPAMGKIGFDFNPTVDRIRVTGSDDSNLRLHPMTGAIAATDANLAFATGDLNASTNPSVGAVAYTNSRKGATTTTLYNYDDMLNVITTQNPPNNGTLNTVGKSGIVVNTADPSSDMDIYFNKNTGANTAFLVANTRNNNDNLYMVDLNTGKTSLVGRIGYGIAVNDFSIAVDTGIFASRPVVNRTSEERPTPLQQAVPLRLYPNPAATVANLEFELENAAPVQVLVSDLTGRTVATLHNGNLPAGLHNESWSVAEYPIGVYLVRLVVDGKILTTNKLVVSNR